MRFNVRGLLTPIAIAACLLALIAWDRHSPIFGRFCWLGWLALRLIIRDPRHGGPALGGMTIILLAVLADRRLWRARSSWLLLPLVTPFLILAVGAVSWKTGPRDTAPGRLASSIEMLTWLPLVIELGLIARFRSKSALIVLSGVGIVAVSTSTCVGMLSGLAVTNDWP